MRRPFTRLLALLFLPFAVWLAGCNGTTQPVAPAGTLSVLQREVTALREESQSAGELQGRLEQRVASLEKQLTETAAQVERTAQAFDEVRGDLETLRASLQQVSQRLEGGAPEERPELTARALNLQSLYTLAFVAHREGRMEEAQRGFETFLEAFPDSLLADNARFHLAEGFARRGEGEQARATLEQLMAAPGDHSMGPEALLLLGELYETASDLSSAAIAYQEIRRQYPGTFSANLAAARLQRVSPPIRGEEGGEGSTEEADTPSNRM